LHELDTTIVLASCDSTSFGGYINPLANLQNIAIKEPTAIILYSQTASSCFFNGTTADLYSLHYLYSFLSTGDSQTVLSIVLNDYPSFVNIVRRDQMSSNNSTGGSGSPPNNTPTTAVAMIILYSITGVITALFLVIIVTGAIRAHRHPERYGPRAGLGRPRQSRAKGIARAMLETLPIVKWGDDEKPVDVEMVGGIPPATSAEKTGENSTQKDSTEATSPVKPDQENSGCSICTDDFEKGQDVRVLPCNHQFHPACIDPWLLNVSGTCPLCRVDLRPQASRSEPAENGISGAEDLPPPLSESTDPSARRGSRRQSLIMSILNPRAMRDATPQQRLAALRQVRQERQSTPAEDAEARSRRRLTLRLQDVFSIHTTRNRPNSVVGSSPVSPLPQSRSVEAIPEGHEPEPHEEQPPTTTTRSEGVYADAISLASPEPSPVGESAATAEAKVESKKESDESKTS